MNLAPVCFAAISHSGSTSAIFISLRMRAGNSHGAGKSHTAKEKEYSILMKRIQELKSLMKDSEINSSNLKNDVDEQFGQNLQSNEQKKGPDYQHGNKRISQNKIPGDKPGTFLGFSGQNLQKKTCTGSSDGSAQSRNHEFKSGPKLQDRPKTCISGQRLQGRTNQSYFGKVSTVLCIEKKTVNSGMNTGSYKESGNFKRKTTNCSAVENSHNTHRLQTQPLIMNNNDTKAKSFVSTLSPKKSLMTESMAISKRLEEAELKIQSLKKTMSILKAGKCAASTKEQKGCKSSDGTKSSTQSSDGETAKTLVTCSISKGGDRGVSFTKNTHCEKLEALSNKKSSSITPISDLITQNLQSQRSRLIGNKDQSNTYEKSRKKEIGKKTVSNNQESQLMVKSITPITDLIDQTMQTQNARASTHQGKIHSTSITPISDLISKNMENLRTKHAKKSGASMKTPKFSKYSPSTLWSQKKNPPAKYSCTVERKFRGYKLVRYPAFSPVTKWNQTNKGVCENIHQSQGVHSFKSPAQKLAYVIKNKYKVVKGNPTNQRPTYLHTVKTRYSLKRVKNLDTRKKLKFTNVRHNSYNRSFQHSWKGSRPKYRNSSRKDWKSGDRFRLDRRGEALYSTPSVLDGQRLVMINGTVYRTTNKGLLATKPAKHRRSSSLWKKLQTSTSKTILVRGVKFQMDANGKTLKRLQSDDGKESTKVSRVDLGGITYIQKSQGVLEQVTGSNSRTVASQVLHKSIRTATAKFRKDNTKLAQRYCKYYNRFGKCRRGSQCQYIHDPTKIAVCTRFLRGTCNITDCPFSHKVDKEKMPVCSYYLKGVCSRDNCPYLHVNVDRNAEICTDFLNGFCPLGVKCKKKHTRICPSFSRSGKCADGKKCKLIHQSKKRRRKSSLGENNRERQTYLGKHKQDAPDDSNEIQIKTRKLPTYISISGYTDPSASDLGTTNQGEQGIIQGNTVSSQNTQENARMKIKPQL